MEIQKMTEKKEIERHLFLSKRRTKGEKKTIERNRSGVALIHFSLSLHYSDRLLYN